MRVGLFDRIRQSFTKAPSAPQAAPAATPNQAPPSGQSVIDSAFVVLDLWMLSHARGWDSIEIRFERVGGAIVVADQNVHIASDAPSSLSDALAKLDAGMLAAELSAAFAALHRALTLDGQHWDQQRARCTRVGDNFTLELLNESTLPATKVELRDDDLMFGEQFHVALDTMALAVPSRQKRLAATIDAHVSKAWDRDNDPSHLLLEFADGRKLVLRADILGSYSRSEQSWCWSWANAFPANATTAARALAKPNPGMGFLRMPGFACQEALAEIVALAAADQMDGRAMLRWELAGKGIVLFFAVELGHAT